MSQPLILNKYNEKAITSRIFYTFVVKSDKMNAVLLRRFLMNILSQLFLILAFSYAGETITTLLHLPVTGSIVGLFLLFGALQLKLIKVKHVEESGSWLKNNMAFLFVPATVGIMPYFDIIQKSWLNITIILIVSTLITYIVTGVVAEFLNKRGVH